MGKTPNLGLNKPERDEFYDIEDANRNMDIIDAAFGNIKKIEVQSGYLRVTTDEGTYAVPVTKIS